jgi:plastocyanin
VRLRRRYVSLVAVLGVAGVALPAVASSEASPSIEAVNQGLYSHSWSPAQASVAAGGVVAFRNATAVPHGVEWVSGPAKPECSGGVPVGNTVSASGAEWSGTCTFAQAGTYTFYCTVHGPEMTGTITVSADGTTTTTTTTPTSGSPPAATAPNVPAAPAEPVSNTPPAGGLSLRSSQRGGSVKGSLKIFTSGAGGRLRIDLFATGASLGNAGHPARVRVGGLRRGSVPAGEVPFAVKLDAGARRALGSHRRLALVVKLTFTPLHGKAFTATRTLIEHT